MSRQLSDTVGRPLSFQRVNIPPLYVAVHPPHARRFNPRGMLLRRCLRYRPPIHVLNRNSGRIGREEVTLVRPGRLQRGGYKRSSSFYVMPDRSPRRSTAARLYANRAGCGNVVSPRQVPRAAAWRCEGGKAYETTLPTELPASRRGRERVAQKMQACQLRERC